MPRVALALHQRADDDRGRRDREDGADDDAHGRGRVRRMGCGSERLWAHVADEDHAATQRGADGSARVAATTPGSQPAGQAKGAMMGVYPRGSKLWITFRDVDGKWRNASTGYNRGQEALAQAVHDEVVVSVTAKERAKNASRGVTLRAFAEAWLAKRETETAADDRGRIYNHILPALGDIPLTELRPRQVRDFVEALTRKKRQGN